MDDKNPSTLGHFLLSSQAHLQGTGRKAEQLGLELALIWDVSVAGSSPTLCTTTLTPKADYLIPPNMSLLWFKNDTTLCYIALRKKIALPIVLRKKTALPINSGML